MSVAATELPRLFSWHLFFFPSFLPPVKSNVGNDKWQKIKECNQGGLVGVLGQKKKVVVVVKFNDVNLSTILRK
jgi:hypothetical protein